MKKKLCFFIIIFSILLTICSYSNANEYVNLFEVSDELVPLNELINNQEEKEKLDEIHKEAEKKVKEENQKNNNTKAILSDSNITYTRPYGAYMMKEVEDDNYDWFYYSSISGNDEQTQSYFIIYKHDLFNNTNTVVYDSRGVDKTDTNNRYVTYYYNPTINILFIDYIKDYTMKEKWGTEHTPTYVMGINIQTGNVVFRSSFDVPQTCEYQPSFAVDSEYRCYFVWNRTGIRIFKKSGEKIFELEAYEGTTNRDLIYIKGISPNNKILFFETKYNSWYPYDYWQSVYEGQQKLDNGSFTYKNSWTVYGRTYPNNYSLQPLWKFINDEYAYDQYGRIAKFDYNVDSEMGTNRQILINLTSNSTDFSDSRPDHPIGKIIGNYIYLLGSNNNLYRINKKDLSFKEYISTGIDGDTTIHNITYNNDTIYLKVGSNYTVKQYGINELTKIKNVIITDQATSNHTIEDIVAKYNRTKEKYIGTDIYTVNPSYTEPYKAGILKDEVIGDGLNKINYYRWLVGLDNITLNNDKMSRNQKGAVILKANNYLTHTPSKPQGMDDDFYKEGYYGCYTRNVEGDSYSGNVGVGDSTPAKSIEGYISDIYNVSFDSATGHRQSMLDPYATAVSFGHCYNYNTTSIYYKLNASADTLKENYYSYPAKGNFPNSEMMFTEYWSIYFKESPKGQVSVNLKINGQSYKGTNLSFENSLPVLNFKLPAEAMNKLGITNEYSYIPAGTKVEVEILGLRDKDYNEITYKYEVYFFDIKSESPSIQDIENLIFDYKWYADTYTDLKSAFGYDEIKLKEHWLSAGIKEGRSGSILYDGKYYLENNGDLKNAFNNDYEKAYKHFVSTGWSELRASSAYYSGKYYRTKYGDLSSLSAYKLMRHFKNVGYGEGRIGNKPPEKKETNTIAETEISKYLYDNEVYYKLYGDLKSAFGTNETKLKSHWINAGIKEGRVASIVFDAKYYLDNNYDLKKAFGNDYQKAYNHFVTAGIKEGRKASKYFDVKYYLNNNGDLKTAFGNNYEKALSHFVTNGIKEGRNASSEFVFTIYKNKNGDLRAAFGNNNKTYYTHYMSVGIRENRIIK